jgi:hypothetical protein
MVTTEQAKQLARGLPDTVEQDHHGRPSFRVQRRIFATLWDERHMNVMLDEPGIMTAIADHSRECSEVWWGRRLAAARVDLDVVEAALLRQLLEDAWETKRAGPARR